MRAGECIIRRIGAVGYAVKVSMSIKAFQGRGGRRLSRLQASATCVASTGIERSRGHYCASLSAVEREGLGSVHTSARENPRRLFGDGGSIELKMGSGDFGRDSAIRWMGGGD